MSQCTENTIVFKKEFKEEFYKRTRESNEHISYIKEIYQKDAFDYLICTFDCNGAPIDIIDDFDWYIIETNYFDNEPFWTQKQGKGDTNWHASTYIKKMIGLEEFKKIEESLMYSDGRL